MNTFSGSHSDAWHDEGERLTAELRRIRDYNREHPWEPVEYEDCDQRLGGNDNAYPED